MSTLDRETFFTRQDLKLLYEVSISIYAISASICAISTSIYAIKDFDEVLRVVLRNAARRRA